MAGNQVAVVIPVYRDALTPEERISVSHLRHFLEDFDQILVGPQSLRVRDSYLKSLRQMRFSDAYFTSTQSYNRLMLAREFYQALRDYEYILIYQLDALVFSSDLGHWCSRGWDYAGAPWFKEFLDDTTEGLWAVGNGGLSLRRVSKFLEVLTSRKHSPPGPTKFRFSSPQVQRAFLRTKRFAYACGYKSSLSYVLKRYSWNEDGFWSFEAQHFADRFVIPSPEEALAFAFEQAPRYCYKLNGEQLPFGCHAWYKADPEFWRPFLLPPE